MEMVGITILGDIYRIFLDYHDTLTQKMKAMYPALKNAEIKTVNKKPRRSSAKWRF